MYFLKVKMENLGKTAYLIGKLRKKYSLSLYRLSILVCFIFLNSLPRRPSHLTSLYSLFSPIFISPIAALHSNTGEILRRYVVALALDFSPLSRSPPLPRILFTREYPSTCASQESKCAATTPQPFSYVSRHAR